MGEVGDPSTEEPSSANVRTVPLLDPAVLAHCTDVLSASQRAGGWHPPPLFALAELCARFGFGHDHPADGLCVGEPEAYACALAQFGPPLLWQCREVGPTRVTLTHAPAANDATRSDVATLERVVVADAVYSTGVAQHRWRLRAECTASTRTRSELTISEPHWSPSRTRLRWLGFNAVTVAQRWRPFPAATRTASPVDTYGVAAAVCFAAGDTVVVYGQRPATLLSELVDVPFVSRFAPTAGTEGL